MLERINQILKSKKLSASKFAEEIGVQRSAMSHILSGRNKPSLEFVQKLLSHFPDIRTDWLLTGKGQMYKDLQLFGADVISPEELKKTDIKDIPAEITKSKEPKIKPEQPSYPLDKAIDKIVIFYSDKTFSEYNRE
jgi:transcriptional regulator with XRE-family HTH domain